MTEAYELLKNFCDPCSTQAYIKKRLEAIVNRTNLAIAPTTCTLLQKAQPTSAAD